MQKRDLRSRQSPAKLMSFCSLHFLVLFNPHFEIRNSKSISISTTRKRAAMPHPISRLRICTHLFAAVLAILSIIAPAAAQLAPAVGIRSNTPSVHAFTNARIVTAPGKVIDNGTMVVRDGLITAVGANVAVPADARVWDMTGKTIYPGLIESASDIGMPKKPQGGRNGGDGGGNAPKDEPRGPHHWNDNV